MPAAIEFRNVAKVYRRALSRDRVEALADVSFEVAPGEVCAFLGPNGAGKTTSISILMGFLFPDSGEIRVLGREPGDVRAKERIGFLPENFAFYKFLTAPKLLRLHMALAGRRSADAERRIADLLRTVKLDGFPSLRIAKYSRGMVQRLGIAQALLADPELLVLDEPTSGLDPAGRKDVLDLIAAMKAAGKTVFLSSHILPEVETVCDRIVIVNRGRLVREGRLVELLGTGDRVEIVVDRLPEELERELAAGDAAVERGEHEVRLLVTSTEKRAVAEMLWGAGCDVLRINPVKDSLEDLFLRLVEGREEIA